MSMDLFDAAIVALTLRVARDAVDEEVDTDFSFDEAVEFCRQSMRYIGQTTSLAKPLDCADGYLRNRLHALGKLFTSEIYVTAIVQYLSALTNLNQFIHFMENTLSELFKSPSDMENGLCGPTSLTETSVLGIFIRSIRAKWQVMDFAQQCGMYNSFASLVQDDVSVDAIQQIAAASALSSQPSISQHNGTTTLIQQIGIACQNHDTIQAEFLIHHLFDTSSSDPLRKQVRKEYRSLQLYVEDLEQSIVGGQRLRPNQSAMITLAVLWLRLNNVERAYIAIEEALKTAHHSGDHPSVVRCLLILFHIFSGEQPLHECVDIIQRCIARAGSLQMHETVAEAALILASLKLQSLPQVGKKPQVASSSGSLHSPGSINTWTFRDTLNILLYALHGETACTVKYCLSKEAISVEDTMTTTTVAQQQSKSNWPTIDELSKTSESYASFSLRAACVQAELWNKQGHAKMAGFVIARALQLYSSSADVEVVTWCLLKKLLFDLEHLLQEQLMGTIGGGEQNTADTIRIGVDPKLLDEQLEQVLDTVVNWLRKFRNLLAVLTKRQSNLNLPSSLSKHTCSKYSQCMLQTVVDILSFFAAVCVRDWQRACRFGEKLQETRCATPLSQFSLPLLDEIDAQRFQVWHKIAMWQRIGYSAKEQATIIAQVENELFTGHKRSFRYLMEEFTVQFLLSFD